MMGLLEHNARLCVFILLASVSAKLTVSNNPDCSADHVSLQSNTCRIQRERFLTIYTTHKPTADRRKRILCGSYRKYIKCLLPVLSSCEEVNQSFSRNWGHVRNLLDCACTKKEKYCKVRLSCLGEEFHGIIFQRCREFYHFQKSETNYNLCHITQNYFSCEYGLVRTACGSDVAMAAHQMSRLNTTVPRSCNITIDSKHTEFRYSERCMPTFPDEMARCRDEHLTGNHRLAFSQHNEMISLGAQREVRRACRALSRYDLCMAEARVCPEGMSLVYDMDGSLRTYLIKLRYICQNASKEYTSNLACLQSMVTNKSLANNCNSLIGTLYENSDNVTAQQFYCKHKPARRLHRRFDRLQNCLKQSYEDLCGKSVGRIMNDLMEQVRYDPYYLPAAYKFKVNCSEQGMATSTQAPVTAPSSSMHVAMTPARHNSVSSRTRSHDVKNLHMITTPRVESTFKEVVINISLKNDSLAQSTAIPQTIPANTKITEKSTTHPNKSETSTSSRVMNTQHTISTTSSSVIERPTRVLSGNINSTESLTNASFPDPNYADNQENTSSTTEHESESPFLMNDTHLRPENETDPDVGSIQIDYKSRKQGENSLSLANTPPFNLIVVCLSLSMLYR